MRAIRSVLKPGGRLGFFAIAAADGLTEADRARLAQRDGNDHVESPLSYEELMNRAGFVDVEVLDVTADFAETAIAWNREWELESAALIELFGATEYARKMDNRILDIAHIEQGLLRRYLVYGLRT